MAGSLNRNPMTDVNQGEPGSLFAGCTPTPTRLVSVPTGPVISPDQVVADLGEALAPPKCADPCADFVALTESFPDLVERFATISRDLIARSPRGHLSARLAFETLRHESAFSLKNATAPYLTRAAIAFAPELAEAFTLAESAADSCDFSKFATAQAA